MAFSVGASLLGFALLGGDPTPASQTAREEAHRTFSDQSDIDIENLKSAHSGNVQGQIARETGFSVHIVEAEAGLHPTQPSPDSEKVLTRDMHVYWLNRQAGRTVEIAGTTIINRGWQIVVALHPTQSGSDTFVKFSNAHIGETFAYVVKGRMIGVPITNWAYGLKKADAFEIVVADRLGAELLKGEIDFALGLAH